ncbi:hypothetical protein ASE69_16535 [Sphingomonas sp. Leaf208]|nr:hypothetical protein ASE69_16535 [Sphingomonas sp. Leaf208]
MAERVMTQFMAGLVLIRHILMDCFVLIRFRKRTVPLLSQDRMGPMYWRGWSGYHSMMVR